MRPSVRILSVLILLFLLAWLATSLMGSGGSTAFASQSEAAMAHHMAQNAREKRPTHAYDDPGAVEWARKARKPFKRYQSFFDVPNEF